MKEGGKELLQGGNKEAHVLPWRNARCLGKAMMGWERENPRSKRFCLAIWNWPSQGGIESRKQTHAVTGEDNDDDDDTMASCLRDSRQA